MLTKLSPLNIYSLHFIFTVDDNTGKLSDCINLQKYTFTFKVCLEIYKAVN